MNCDGALRRLRKRRLRRSPMTWIKRWAWRQRNCTRNTLADEDLAAANALLDKADQTLILVNDNDAQAKRIATNYTQFETAAQGVSPGVFD